MPSSVARTGAARFTDAVNALVDALREHGAGIVLWPIAIGAALAASALETFGPESTRPHACPLSTRPVLLGVVGVAVVACLAMAVALVRTRRAGGGLVAAFERAVRIG